MSSVSSVVECLVANLSALKTYLWPKIGNKLFFQIVMFDCQYDKIIVVQTIFQGKALTKSELREKCDEIFSLRRQNQKLEEVLLKCQEQLNMVIV